MYKRVFFKCLLFFSFLFLASVSFVYSLHPSYLFFENNYVNRNNVEVFLLVTPSEDYSPGSELKIFFPADAAGQWCKNDAEVLSVSGSTISKIDLEGWTVEYPLPGTLSAVCNQGMAPNFQDSLVISDIDALVGGTSYGLRIDGNLNLSTGSVSGSNNIVVQLTRGLITESVAYAVYLQTSGGGVTVTAFVDEDFFSTVQVLDPVVEKGIWSRVRVRILDSQGNPIPGRQIEININLEDLTNWEIENPSGTTNSSGVFQTRVRGFETGIVNIGATDKTFSQDIQIQDSDNLTVTEVPTITLHQLPMYTSGLSRKITWNSLSGNYQYFIEASLDSSFSTIVKTSGWISNNEYTFQNLESGKAYYYRGKVRNIAEVESAYSNIVSSIQAEKPSGVIQVLNPIVEKGIWSRVRITLVDSQGNPMPGRRIFFKIDRSDMTNWEIEQPANLTNSNGVAEGRIRGFEVATVRVTAEDRTIPLNFTIDAFDWLQVTQVPTITLHNLPNYSLGLSRLITWNNILGDYEYQIQLSTNPNFTNVRNSGWIRANQYTFGDLNHGQGYFYRGRLRNSAGVQSSYSNIVSSIQDNEPPEIDKVDFSIISRNQVNRARFTFLIKDLSGVSNVSFECKVPGGEVYVSCGSISSLNDFHYIVLERNDLQGYESEQGDYFLEYCVRARDMVGNRGSFCSERTFSLEDVDIIEEEEKEKIIPPETPVGRIITPIRRTLEDTVAYIQDLELDDARFATTSLALVSTLAPATLLTFALSPALFYPLIQAFLGLFAIFKKKRKILPYGYVYDAISKEPINKAIVRIYKDDRLVYTTVSNVYGIFTATLDPGKYHLVVSIQDYSYPSKLITGEVDAPLENIYRGGKFIVDEESHLQYSIPLDPVDFSKTSYIKAYIINNSGRFLILLQKLFITLGFLLALFLYFRNPTTFNLMILLIYIPLVFFHLFLTTPSKKHNFGVVKNIKGDLLEGITLGLRELEFEKIVAKRVTNDKGRYKFLVPGGRYQLEVLDSEYEIKKIEGKSVIFETNIKKPLLVDKGLVLEKKNTKT